MYSLCDDSEDQKAKSGEKTPDTFEDFYAWFLKTCAHRKLTASLDKTTQRDHSIEEALIQALPECSVCACGSKVDVRMLVRNCTRTRNACEGHRCVCCEQEPTSISTSNTTSTTTSTPTTTPSVVPNSNTSPQQQQSPPPPPSQQQQQHKIKHFPCCSRCLAQILWNTTNSLMKSQGRYRGHCPFCKAEFCSQDVLLIDIPGLNKKQQQQQQRSGGKNKKKGRT